MGYCTRDQLIDHVGGATRAAKLTAESGATPDNAQIDNKIAEMSGLIDSYLTQRYGSPLPAAVLSASVNVLRGVVLDLGSWALHSLRPPVPPDVMTNYGHRITWLEKLAEGKADLPTEDAASGGHAPLVDSPDRVFGRGEDGGL